MLAVDSDRSTSSQGHVSMDDGSSCSRSNRSSSRSTHCLFPVMHTCQLCLLLKTSLCVCMPAHRHSVMLSSSCLRSASGCCCCKQRMMS